MSCHVSGPPIVDHALPLRSPMHDHNLPGQLPASSVSRSLGPTTSTNVDANAVAVTSKAVAFARERRSVTTVGHGSIVSQRSGAVAPAWESLVAVVPAGSSVNVSLNTVLQM